MRSGFTFGRGGGATFFWEDRGFPWVSLVFILPKNKLRLKACIRCIKN